MATLRNFILNRVSIKNQLIPLVDFAVSPESTGDPAWNAVADKLNELIAPQPVQQTKVIERKITALGIMSALGAERGAAVLESLKTASETSAPIRWAMTFLTNEQGINLGDTETRRMLDELATNSVLQSADTAFLKSLAEVQEIVDGPPLFSGYPVSELQIRQAVFNDDGSRVF